MRIKETTDNDSIVSSRRISRVIPREIQTAKIMEMGTKTVRRGRSIHSKRPLGLTLPGHQDPLAPIPPPIGWTGQQAPTSQPSVYSSRVNTFAVGGTFNSQPSGYTGHNSPERMASNPHKSGQAPSSFAVSSCSKTMDGTGGTFNSQPFPEPDAPASNVSKRVSIQETAGGKGKPEQSHVDPTA